MNRSAKSLLGFSIGATDGEIGTVKEFYFDDETWTVRYLVVETGSWLFGRKVLIAPHAVTATDWDNEVLAVNLTKDQVKHSPDIDTERPVSRQQEIELYQYYPWGDYWGGGLWAGGMGVTGMMMPANQPLETAIHKENDTSHNDDPHLRSTDDVTGYNLKATDGEIGEIEDFIIANNWMINYVVVDTGNWFPGKKVIISPKWIKNIDWNSTEIIVDATVEQVKNAPEYDPATDLTDEYQSNLQNYYGRYL